MALSRFWLAMIVSSIIYILFLWTTGTYYSIDQFVNGKRGGPVLVAEVEQSAISPAILDSIKLSADAQYVVQGSAAEDSLFVLDNGLVRIYVGKQKADGLLPTCKNTITDILLPLIAYLTFFCGILQLLIDSGAAEKLAKVLSPVFVKIFPDVPANHPSISYMTLNFAANFLGLDSAATPFGLKAMASLQELNPEKEKASNSQIMFMCLHAAGLTLIPTSIIGYRAAAGAANPADVMIPCIFTSFVGTIAALLIVGIKQRINLLNATIVLSVGVLMGVMAGLLFYINALSLVEKNHFTNNLSNLILLGIILLVALYAWYREKHFTEKGINVFSSFVNGGAEGLKTGATLLPYIIGMLVAISVFRNSGIFEILAAGIAKVLTVFHVDKSIVDAMPVALLRPFSSSGSRGFMLDAMNTFGPDSFTARLSCVLQCAAETTFYVIAVYFGSINVRNTRYTVSVMLLVDFVCVLAAIGICALFFGL